MVYKLSNIVLFCDCDDRTGWPWKNILFHNETGEKRQVFCDSLYVTNFNEWGRVVSWGLIGHLETEARQLIKENFL